MEKQMIYLILILSLMSCGDKTTDSKTEAEKASSGSMDTTLKVEENDAEGQQDAMLDIDTQKVINDEPKSQEASKEPVNEKELSSPTSAPTSGVKSSSSKPLEPKISKEEVATETNSSKEQGEVVTKESTSSDRSAVQSKPKVDTIEPPAFAVVEVSHDAWDLLLRKYVTPTGQVDYSGLKQVESKLDAYLQDLSNYPPQSTMSRSTQMAYWINAYNAFTVKLILKNWPVKSIMNLNGGKAWDVKWIELGGQKYSLNQIEHDILRKDFPDPRIHFAVNCAAQSCPPLWNRAWNENNLESSLEKQAKTFINNEKYNQVAADKIKLSKIFEWYKSDFGDLRKYVDLYSDVDISEKAKVRFNEYDWSLNGK